LTEAASASGSIAITFTYDVIDGEPLTLPDAYVDLTFHPFPGSEGRALKALKRAGNGAAKLSTMTISNCTEA
jgi:hypothetical protein